MERKLAAGYVTEDLKDVSSGGVAECIIETNQRRKESI